MFTMRWFVRINGQKFSFKYERPAAVEGVVGKYYPAEDVVLKKGPTPVRNPPKVGFFFLFIKNITDNDCVDQGYLAARHRADSACRQIQREEGCLFEEHSIWFTSRIRYR